MTNPTRPTHLRRTVLAVAAALVLAACGGDAATPPAPDAAEDEAAAGDDVATDESSDDGNDAVPEQDEQETEESAEGWCADFPVADVQAAVGDMVELTDSSPQPNRPEQCNYTVADAEGVGLAFYESNPGLYEQRVAQAEGLDEEAVQRPDLGAEAILLNNADLTILLADGRELVVAVQAFFTDGREVDQAALADAIVSLGELVVERKG